MEDTTTASQRAGAFGSARDTSDGRIHSRGNGDNEPQSGFLGRVRESAAAQLSTQKDRAVDGIGSAARAVRQSSQQLRDQQHETVAGYVEQGAVQIERMSQRLREKDMSELLNDAQRLARRQPALFVGAAFAIGLIGARFMKSSRDDDQDAYGSRDTDGPSSSYARHGSGRAVGAWTGGGAEYSASTPGPGAMGATGMETAARAKTRTASASPVAAESLDATDTDDQGSASGTPASSRTSGRAGSAGPRTRRAGSDPERI